ncbi:MAG: anion permease [Veillonellaceae bacterium]|nr:anion permease [Veillonellaceae bacterium]
MIAVGAGIWFSPVPAGLKPAGWHLLAIFVAVIIGFILKPMPIGAIAFAGVTLSAFTHVLKPAEALSGYANTTIWLIVSAFLFSKAFVKTGLGQRISFLIVKAIGHKTLNLGYAIILSDLVLAPMTPSNTARAGGVIFPIVRSLCSVFDSYPGPSARRIGAFLMKAEYQGDGITSTMFMTASSANVLFVALAASTFNIRLSWSAWALGALLPGLVALLVVPYFIYKVYPPEIKETPQARQLAESELEKLGPIKPAEKILIGIFITMLGFWATAEITHIEATIVAMAGVIVMILTKILTWSDVTHEHDAWDTLIWMGSLIALANYLNKLGVIPWFAKIVGTSIVGVSWPVALGILSISYFFIHYCFASMSAHVTALLPAFGAVAIAAGVPPYLAILVLAYSTHLSQSLTHYATGPAPIFFGAGYVDQGTWWTLGFYIALINLTIFAVVGIPWWRALGFW